MKCRVKVGSRTNQNHILEPNPSDPFSVQMFGVYMLFGSTGQEPVEPNNMYTPNICTEKGSDGFGSTLLSPYISPHLQS